MQSFIFSPRFILQEMLKLKFNRVQAKHLQKVTEKKSEKTIYNWFKRGRMGKESEYRELMRSICQTNEVACCPINSNVFIQTIKDPDWREFIALSLQSEDNMFCITTKTMHYHLNNNQKDCSNNLDFYSLGSCLPVEVTNSLKKDFLLKWGQRELLENFVELCALICYLAMYEIEYCASIEMESSFIQKILPCYIKGKDEQILTPVNLFFQKLFDGFIDQSLFRDKDSLAKEIEYWRGHKSLEDAQRAIDRYSNERHLPSWKTFNDWIEMVITKFVMQHEKNTNDDAQRKEAEILHLQNLYGGALLIDKAYRMSEQMLKQIGLDPVDYFRIEYSACFERLKKEGRFNRPSKAT